METNVLAIIIQEGSRFLSEFIKNRQSSPVIVSTEDSEDSMDNFIQSSELRLKQLADLRTPEELEEPKKLKATPAVSINIQQKSSESIVQPGKAQEIAVGCVPCSMGHFGTCSGLLNESVRFSHGGDGVGSPEVIDRVNMCMDELNAMERVDLRPEMITQLSGWEKELAEKVLTESTRARHKLEGLTTAEELEEAASTISTTRKEIGREWFQHKLGALSKEDKDEVSKRIMAKIEEMANDIEEEVEV